MSKWLSLSSLLMLCQLAFPQGVPLTASINASPQAPAVVVVNNSPSFVTAFALQSDFGGQKIVQIFDFRINLSQPPLRPAETRTLQAVRKSAADGTTKAPDSVAVIAAVFEDDTAVGDNKAIAHIKNARNSLVAELQAIDARLNGAAGMDKATALNSLVEMHTRFKSRIGVVRGDKSGGSFAYRLATNNWKRYSAHFPNATTDQLVASTRKVVHLHLLALGQQ